MIQIPISVTQEAIASVIRESAPVRSQRHQ
jgi:hypothetical protein